jgi:hypothetical protein
MIALQALTISPDSLLGYTQGGQNILVHLIEYSSSTSNGQVVRCGLDSYRGDHSCVCPEGQAKAPHWECRNNYDDMARRFQRDCEESLASVEHRQQARVAGHAYAPPVSGYAVSPPPAYPQMAEGYAPAAYALQHQAGYAVSAPPAAAAGPAGHYTTNAYGLPVNTAHGHVDTERRAVHLSNLSRKTRAKDVRQLVERKKIGRVLSVDVHSDGAAAERCKGSCVVHFATADEANYAVGMLNDYEWLGERKIRARLAKEAATVGERAPGPVIVNGTTHGGQ